MYIFNLERKKKKLYDYNGGRYRVKCKVNGLISMNKYLIEKNT